MFSSDGVKTYLVMIPMYHPLHPQFENHENDSSEQNKPSKFCGLNGVQQGCRKVFPETELKALETGSRRWWHGRAVD